MPLTPVAAVVVPEPCYRCGSITRPLAGVLITTAEDRRPFLEFECVASAVAGAVSPDELAALRIGRIAARHSRARGIYVANGCHACDAILGSHHVMDSLNEFLCEGGSIDKLIVAHWSLDLDLNPEWQPSDQFPRLTRTAGSDPPQGS